MIALHGGRLVVKGPATLRGTLEVPGDKSLSHRALICAALAEGESVIDNLAPGADVESTAKAVRAFGVIVDGGRVDGAGPEGFSEPDDVVDCGNSGTSIRLLAGLCAGFPFTSVLSGDASLRSRPMRRVVEPLRAMGAEVVGRHDGDRAPLGIRGGDLSGVQHRSAVASGQVKSALMLAALFASGPTSIELPAGGRDHTERMFRTGGIEVETAIKAGSELVTVRPGRLSPLGRYRVPGDMSSAAFLLAAAAVLPGSDVTVEGVGVNPTRAAVLEVLREMGAGVDVSDETEVLGEPVATVRVQGAERLRAVDLPPEVYPRVQDEIPVLTVLMARAHGRSTVSGAGELRLKETDRIAAMTEGLARLGVRVKAAAEGFSIDGPQEVTGGRVDPCADHRVAMAMAVAGLCSAHDVVIEGADCIAVSYPGFVDDVTTLLVP